MKGRRSQRGSRSRQTGGTVLRLHRPGAYWWQSSLHRAPTAADARIGPRVRLWPLSLCLGGPGEPSGGSVRPRGRPLRPDGVRTAPMRAWTDLPGKGKGLTSKRKSGACTTPWTWVHQGGMTTENERRRFYVGADMARPGDETTRSRARTPKSDNIREALDRRHGLRRAPEGGRRMDGRADVGGGRGCTPMYHSS